MAGHAQLKFVMMECSKTQIRLTGLIWQYLYSFVPVSGFEFEKSLHDLAERTAKLEALSQVWIPLENIFFQSLSNYFWHLCGRADRSLEKG